MPRMDYRLFLSAAPAAAIPAVLLCSGAAPAQPANGPSATTQIPDLSGIWNKERGRVGAVKDLSRARLADRDRPLFGAACRRREEGELRPARARLPGARGKCRNRRVALQSASCCRERAAKIGTLEAL